MIVILMAYTFRATVSRHRIVAILVCICTVFLAVPVSAESYSQDYTGYLGETIDLSGVLYTGDTIYLFMTGPGLPANGVPLTDTSKRADRGDFTIIGVGSDQHWSYKWDTSKIDNQIDPGTYLVYAVNAPADASSLAGHSYQTLSVYLKDGMLAKDRVSVGTKYTLNLADDEPATSQPTPTITTATPALPPMTTLPETTLTTAVPAPVTTKKSPVLLVMSMIALVVSAFCIARMKRE